MNTISGFYQAKITAGVVAAAIVLCWSPLLWADTRQEALSELSRLNQAPRSQFIHDEIRSIEATFDIAEHYFQAHEIEQSERFYLLALQKARIVLASLPEASREAPAAAPAAVRPQPPETDRTDSRPPAGDSSFSGAEQQTTAAPSAETQAAAPAVPDSSVVVQDVSIPLSGQDPGDPSEEIMSEKLVGTASTYTVVKGDTIRLVAAKLGVTRQHIIRRNNLDEKAYLKIGQKLVYNNRKIVPQRMKNGIVVNIPDRTLYYFKQGRLAVSLPVALGIPVKSEKYDWKTPTGKFRVTAKMKDPTWHVPPSIQSEMEDLGREIITSIPPGPENPLGKYAIKTSIPGILIHSTTKPWSIYSFASHGCIRVYPEQMEELFREVTVNTPGEIIYKPVKLAVTETGRVFLEVHRDVYGMNSNGLAQEARRLIEKQKLSDQVDWQKVESMVRRTSGIAEDISL